MNDVVTKNGVQFASLEGTRPLKDALYVAGPYEVQNAPNAYSFLRSNKIKVDWLKVLQAAGIKPARTNAAQLKRYVEYAWKKSVGTPTEAEIKYNSFDLQDDWSAYVHDPATLQNSPDNKKRDYITIFKGKLAEYRKVPEALDILKIEKGTVFRIPTRDGERWYQPIIDDGITLALPPVSEFIKDWEKTWDKVTALVQVYFPGKKPADSNDAEKAKNEAIDRAKKQFSAIELIRADAATIKNQYSTLMHAASAAKKP